MSFLDDVTQSLSMGDEKLLHRFGTKFDIM